LHSFGVAALNVSIPDGRMSLAQAFRHATAQPRGGPIVGIFTLGSTEVDVRNEHDDDLAPTVDARNDMETQDYPKTSDDFDAQEPGEDEDQPGDGDEESVIGK
jgi:hypothetical protein